MAKIHSRSRASANCTKSGYPDLWQARRMDEERYRILRVHVNAFLSFLTNAIIAKRCLSAYERIASSEPDVGHALLVSLHVYYHRIFEAYTNKSKTRSLAVKVSEIPNLDRDLHRSILEVRRKLVAHHDRAS